MFLFYIILKRIALYWSSLKDLVYYIFMLISLKQNALRLLEIFPSMMTTWWLHSWWLHDVFLHLTTALFFDKLKQIFFGKLNHKQLKNDRSSHLLYVNSNITNHQKSVVNKFVSRLTFLNNFLATFSFMVDCIGSFIIWRTCKTTPTWYMYIKQES